MFIQNKCSIVKDGGGGREWGRKGGHKKGEHGDKGKGGPNRKKTRHLQLGATVFGKRGLGEGKAKGERFGKTCGKRIISGVARPSQNVGVLKGKENPQKGGG